MHDMQYRMIAKTLPSLEDVLAVELEELGATDIEIGRRMVSFLGDKSTMYKANLRLRTALRILKPVHTFRASNPDELYEALMKFDWSTIMTSRQTFAIDTVVYSESFTHSKYVGYRAKDAVVDFWRSKMGDRPSVRLDNPDIYINIHIAHQDVTLSLDSSGESLHKRGYREVQTDAPINEVLAAGILLKSGWRGEMDLLDPMCGSGTFLIEAALIARNIAPGIYRQSFAFERWLDYDRGLFDEIYNDDSAEREFLHQIIGSDILPNAIKVSERNVARAGLSRDITLEVSAFQDRSQPQEPCMIVMNPPYGERLKLMSPERLYSMIGERLKHNYPGCNAWIIAYRPEHFDSIGLRHSSRTELMNGSLDCELRSYELFAGKREDYKSATRPPRYANRSEQRPKADHPTKSERITRPNREDRPRKEKILSYEKSQDRMSRERQSDRSANDSSRHSDRRNDSSRGSYKDRSRNSRNAHLRGNRDAKLKAQRGSLWPSDRFNFTDEEGRQKRRPPKSTSFQVFRSEEDN